MYPNITEVYMNSRLRTTMWVITAFLAVIGALFVFAPETARSVFGIVLSDEALTLVFGEVVLNLAFMAYLVATNDVLAKMTTGFMVLFVGHVLVFGYQLATNVQTFAQVEPPLIISVIFATLLYFYRK